MGVGMLQSFTVPKSPFGRARLTPPLTNDLTVAEAWIGEDELNVLELHGEEVLASSWGFPIRSPIRRSLHTS